MIPTLAWRNIWRNKRRTLITATSIMFAVLAASCMKSIQKGAWDHMVDNVAKFYFGYAQIHQKGYWADQSINRSFQYSDSLLQVCESIPEIKGFVPRLESFALASFEDNSRGVLVVGADVDRENRMTNLKERMTNGSYLEDNDDGVIIAEGLGQDLKLSIGDTLVLLSQGYRGLNAAGLFPVRGMVRFGSPELNKQMLYLALPRAQEFFGAESMLTSIAIDTDDKDEVSEILKTLESKLGADQYEFMDWITLIPDLVQAKALDEAGGTLILGLLYLIITFGIFGTILMMIKERQYEFGVLISIGFKRWKLAFMVWLEILAMGLIGAFAGILISIPIVNYLFRNPIRFTGDMAEAYLKFGVEPVLPAAFDIRIFAFQALVIFFATSILALYPIFKIKSLHPVKAMRI